MAIAQLPVYQEVYRFLASQPTHEEILDFRPSEAVATRVQTLLEANKSRGLSEAEQAELDQFGQVEHFVRMLKLSIRSTRENTAP